MMLELLRLTLLNRHYLSCPIHHHQPFPSFYPPYRRVNSTRCACSAWSKATVWPRRRKPSRRFFGISTATGRRTTPIWSSATNTLATSPTKTRFEKMKYSINDDRIINNNYHQHQNNNSNNNHNNHNHNNVVLLA